MTLKFESHFIPSANEHQLHLMEIFNDGNTTSSQQGVVLMVHGMIEDGRIFYHPSGKGLGSYLAQQGYRVFVADLRGIGRSYPAIGKNSEHGQTETIVEDLPLLINHCIGESNDSRIHLISHSWGGVFINSCLVRFPELAAKIYSAVHFGSKRNVRAKTFDRILRIEIVWKHVATRLAKKFGYLPAIKYKFGSNNETQKTLLQTIDWIIKDEWIDTDDGFDYQQAADKLEAEQGLPPSLYYAAPKDYSLGHHKDVSRFMQQSGTKNAKYHMLNKKNGHLKDYDHLDMLTAPEGINDHFPKVLGWMRTHSK